MTDHSRPPGLRFAGLAGLVLLGLLALAVPVGLGLSGLRSTADFSDAEQFGANRLVAGTVEISITLDSLVETGGGDGPEAGSEVGGRVAERSKPVVLTAPNMAPGDHTSGSLQLTNAGSLPFRFHLTGVLADDSGSTLTDWLLFEAWLGDTCEVDEPAVRQSTNMALGSAPAYLVGSADADDPALVVEPGEEVTICVAAGLPMAAPNQTQDQSADIELVIVASQVVAS